MKKRYLLLAGLLIVAMAAGCGKKDDTSGEAPQVTATPTPEVTKAAGQLVEMQKSDDSNIKNVMGEKTETASKVVLINQTGDDIEALYIRPNTDSEDEETWGEDLINKMFTLTNGDKALYYYDKNVKDDEGKTVTSYDVRITYTDEDKNECFFRKLPLTVITQLTLRMDGTGEDSIPYATYLTGTGTKETSTLNEVKKRLGLDDEDSSSADDSDNADDNTDENANTGSGKDNTQSSDSDDNSQNDSQGNSGNSGDTQNPSEQDSGGSGTDSQDKISIAEGYIGQSLDSLISACGQPTGEDYEDEPETGRTGYHYYSNFTVSTTVDENGNEIVAGVW